MPRSFAIRAICAALVGVTLIHSRAFAVPDPRNCSSDAVGVGDTSGNPIGGSSPGFHITLRDVNNTPILTGWAGLAFAGSGVRVYSAQNSGVTVDAASQSVTENFTSGAATFVLRTGGFNNSGAVEVIGDGVVLGLARWRSTDVDATDGRTGLGDVNYVAERYLAAVRAPECNFDRSASDVPDLVDLTIVADEYLRGGSGSYAW